MVSSSRKANDGYQDQPLDVLAAEGADQRVLDGLREAVVHGLPDAGHLAEDRCLRHVREHQLPAVGRHAIELRRSLLDQEHHLAGLAGPVEHVSRAAARHLDRVVERLQLRRGEVAEQFVRLQVGQLGGRCRGPRRCGPRVVRRAAAAHDSSPHPRTHASTSEATIAAGSVRFCKQAYTGAERSRIQRAS